MRYAIKRILERNLFNYLVAATILSIPQGNFIVACGHKNQWSSSRRY
jgi:hypothetical protein